MTSNTITSNSNQTKETLNSTFNFNFDKLPQSEQYLLTYLFHHFLSHGQDLGEFNEVSKKHFEKGIAYTIKILTGKKIGRYSTYNKPLKSLISKGILERTDYYSKQKGVAKSVRFSPKFIFSRGCLDIVKKCKQNRLRVNNTLCRYTDTMVRKLSLRADIKIESLVDSLITTKYIKNVIEIDISKVDHQAYQTLIELKKGKSYKKQPLPLKKAIEIANKREKQIFFHKKERLIIITSETKFIDRKIEELRIKYKALLYMVKNKDYFPTTISKTNERLTSFFTVFPNSLLPYIQFDKTNFNTYDISNSQFCFLANIIDAYRLKLDNKKESKLYRKIEKESEYFEAFKSSYPKLLGENGNLSISTQHFITAACQGSFYEEVARIAKITRGEAKKGMFIVAFSSHRYNPILKKKIKEAFPEVIDFIDQFKKLKPNKEKNGFAVWLQRIESSICVQEVLKRLQPNYKILTRHDSFTINSNTHKLKFKEELESILDEFLLGGYKLREEGNHVKKQSSITS